jgi:DNA polymerase III gamma/tau subunit
MGTPRHFTDRRSKAAKREHRLLHARVQKQVEVTLSGTKQVEVTLSGTKQVEVTPPETKQVEVTLSGTNRAKVTLSGTNRAKVTQPETNRAKVTQPETNRAKVTQPETKRVKVTPPETKQVEVTQSEKKHISVKALVIRVFTEFTVQEKTDVYNHQFTTYGTSLCLASDKVDDSEAGSWVFYDEPIAEWDEATQAHVLCDGMPCAFAW